MGMIDGESLISEMPWLVNLIKGNTIKDIARVCRSTEGNTDDNPKLDTNLFIEGSGPLFIHLDNGLVVGVKTDRRVKSLSYWIEDDNQGNGDMAYDEELIKRHNLKRINHSNLPSQPKDILNKEVVNIFVIKSKSPDPIYTTRPNQYGLKIELIDGNFFYFLTGDIADCHFSYPGFFYNFELDTNEVEQLLLPLDKLLYLKEPRVPSYLK